MTSKPFEAIVAALLLFGTASAQAEQNWIVRGRILNVAPNDKSGEVSTLPGSSVSVDDDTTIELDFTYMYTPNVGVEFILGTSRHDLRGEGSIAGLGKIAEARTLPPVVTVQYHFAPAGAIRPYAGLGVNYTRFYDEKTTAALDAALGPTSLELDSSTGLVGQVGVDIPVGGGRWFVNFDAKYISMDTTARLKSAGTVRTVGVDIDPWFLGFGIGTRF